MQNTREAAVLKLYELTDEEVVAVLQYMEALHALPEDYNEADDPTVGLLAGPTDLSVRAKDTLLNEITARSGWTQKKD